MDDIRTLRPNADLFFITGADAMEQIMTWRNVDQLWGKAHFVGVSRPGHELTDFGLADEVSLMEIPAMAISSTDCRDRVAAGKPVWYLVPDGVVQYIGKYGLYVDNNGNPHRHNIAPMCRHHRTTDRRKMMSKPYPSCRELRLQRERNERAKLRDQEAQRWADEVNSANNAPLKPNNRRTKPGQAEPVPASDVTPIEEEPAVPLQMPLVWPQSSVKPIDAPSDGS